MCELVGSGRGAAARPAFVAGTPIALGRRARGRADVGDLVTVQVRGGGAEVVAVHGKARSPRAAIAALMAHEQVGQRHPAAVLEEAEAAAPRAGAADPERRDLRDQRVITIDPEGAKDHDDAIALRAEGEAVRLWVHIADVAYFVASAGALDREAARRGCSVYLPGTVDPMLPPRLSTDVCSLRPGVPRKVVTVELLLDAAGEVAEARFGRSLIRSDRRLTYPEVDRMLGGGTLGDPALDDDVRLAHMLAGRLRARRMRRGALDIVSAEPSFRFHGDRVVDVRMEEQTASHSLIEECMIAANEAVARFLIRKGVPTLFRTHGDPEQVRIERLHEQLEALGVGVPPLPEGPLTAQARRAAARDAAAAVRRHTDRTGRGARSLPYLVLRALRQAVYTPDDPSHSGLASSAYLHFTSPIRRYPDLIAHRSLLHALGLGEPAPDRAWIAEAAVQSSETERAAADLERRADRMCLAYLLRDRMERGGWDEVHEAEVTGMAPAGLFLVFGEAFEGFLPLRWMDRDHYRIDPLDTAVTGEATGERIAIGDRVPVRVAEIEPLRGRVTLEPALRRGRPEPERVRGRRGRPARGGR
ncbi:MAG: RNB domain-containing ribonuclease [Thermoleophilia bacterium]|nr:RNB domain-containing ribonuclease [Thermoleophilia bacterium]